MTDSGRVGMSPYPSVFYGISQRQDTWEILSTYFFFFTVIFILKALQVYPTRDVQSNYSVFFLRNSSSLCDYITNFHKGLFHLIFLLSEFLILFHNCVTHLDVSQVKSTKQGTKEPYFSP